MSDVKQNTVPNRQVICEVLTEAARRDPNIVVLCSDSRGSASLAPFAEAFPQQFVETGIAEQNLVSVSAGLAACGKRPFAASPACFLSTRSMEQARVDVAYSGTNVKLIGISGGVSYGALGMTHHSAQDIAVMGSIPGLRVYLPSDRHQTRRLMETLVRDDTPAYVRVGRNAVADVYDADNIPFVMDKATCLQTGGDVTLIACGELVRPALDAAALLEADSIHCTVLDMYCLKPLDADAIERAARATRLLVTLEEHSILGGLGSLVSQVVTRTTPVRVLSLALPDAAPIAGKSDEVLRHYGLEKTQIAASVKEALAAQLIESR